jgi:hypothetical protein
LISNACPQDEISGGLAPDFKPDLMFAREDLSRGPGILPMPGPRHLRVRQADIPAQIIVKTRELGLACAARAPGLNSSRYCV